MAEIPVSIRFVRANEAIASGKWAPLHSISIQRLDMDSAIWVEVGRANTDQFGNFSKPLSFQSVVRGLYTLRFVDSDHESRLLNIDSVNMKELEIQKPSVNPGAIPDANHPIPQTVHTIRASGLDTVVEQAEAFNKPVWNFETKSWELRPKVDLVRGQLQGKPVFDQSQYPNVALLPSPPGLPPLPLPPLPGLRRAEVPLFFPPPDTAQLPPNSSPEVPLFMPKTEVKKPATNPDGSYAV